MINIISQIQTYKTFPAAGKYIPAFRSMDDGDTLILNLKDNYKMENDKYEKTNYNFYPDKELEVFSKKIKHLPLMMDGVMFSVQGYLSGKLTTADFTNIFLDRTSLLAKRVNLGKDKEDYIKNYSEELDFIKAFNPLCNNYFDKEIDKKTLDSELENLIIDYNSKPERKRKFFIQ